MTDVPRFVLGNVFEVDLPRRSFALVYADPPYAGCRFQYARHNNLRQWGRNARADFTRELIARMDELRSSDGVCALSMSTPELRLLHLFPSKARVAAWVKPYAPMRPGVWPCFAWEPVVMWGRFPNREEQRTARTPHDWLELSPRVPRKGGHETPKPDAFGDWVINIALGPREGQVLDLFCGSGSIMRAAIRSGRSAVGVDTVDYGVDASTVGEIASG